MAYWFHLSQNWTQLVVPGEILREKSLPTHGLLFTHSGRWFLSLFLPAFLGYMEHINSCPSLPCDFPGRLIPIPFSLHSATSRIYKRDPRVFFGRLIPERPRAPSCYITTWLILSEGHSSQWRPFFARFGSSECTFPSRGFFCPSEISS